jgi:hypothetical protein
MFRTCYLLISIGISLSFSNAPVIGADFIRITADNYEKVVPKGKEVDAIYGDFLLQNDRVSIVIAKPVAGRNANMTVRGVSGMIIDFTRRKGGSDQLSCFYPTAGRYAFDNEESLIVSVDGRPVDFAHSPLVSGKQITLQLEGKAIIADSPTMAHVKYTLRDNHDWLEYEAIVSNVSDKPQTIKLLDSIRCDGAIFKYGSDEATRLFFAEDVYWGQSYGFILNRGNYKQSNDKRGLAVVIDGQTEREISPGGSTSWGGKLYCSQGLPGVRSWAMAFQNNQPTTPVQLKLQSPQGVIEHAKVEILSGGQSLGTIDSDAEGIIRTDLIPGQYVAKIASTGREIREQALVVSEKPLFESLSMPAASRVQATIVNEQNQPIAAKVQFLPMDGTAMPDLGPDSANFALKNVVYCARGKFEHPIPPGKYQVVISHGPEFDADKQNIEVRPNQLLVVKSTLKQSVDTRGWISSDFHSHSTPSGDNVSSQLGRVLNLLAEHIEFAPCTEHNRIESYEEELTLLNAVPWMATCTGMELTGSPLPINHQNAFPLKRFLRQQDGGGPVTDADPVKQIERLALWDSGAAKVVQSNHPNIPQILGDRDLDGKPDEGFRNMFGWMDVIEVHPPEGIFNLPTADILPADKKLNPIFFWLQLLNLGYRIPGVVNTDAHYNFHGSGWLRNYIECSTDDPSKIQVDEMIHSAEHGRMVMTTGPFLQTQVRLKRDGRDEFYTCGEDVVLDQLDAKLWIRVQCPNWFDINRVQVFANGRPMPELNFTRKLHEKMFSDKSVRFECEIDLPKFKTDTHVIVATIGEGLTLGPVMGEDRGKLVPSAVANPIFIDVDGGGFKANGDNLGIPFMLPADGS